MLHPLQLWKMSVGSEHWLPKKGGGRGEEWRESQKGWRGPGSRRCIEKAGARQPAFYSAPHGGPAPHPMSFRAP